MGFWSRLLRRLLPRVNHTAAPLAKIEEEKAAVQHDMEQSRSGLRREASERQRYEAIRQRLIDEFEVAAQASDGLRRTRRGHR
jgi:hypothetical protein